MMVRIVREASECLNEKTGGRGRERIEEKKEMKI
jgi:hypothetical protein